MKETVLLTGSDGYISKNFKHRYSNKLNFVEVDRKSGTEVLNIKDFTGVRHIIHLAAISGIEACERDREQTIVDNISSTLFLMKKSDTYNIPMVFASSQGAKNPDNLYSLTKRICEIQAKQHKNIKVLRFANVYGGLNYLTKKTSVVSKFFNAKLNKEPLIINGDGKQERDFIHVDDVVKAIYNSLDKQLPAYPIDIGTGVGTSISSLASMISDNIIHKQSRSVGVESNIADIADIVHYLGFKPSHRKLSKFCAVGT